MPKNLLAARPFSAGALICAAALALWNGGVAAQEAVQEAIPGPEAVAALLADSDSRQEGLLAMAAVARFRQGLQETAATVSPDTVRQDLAWLQRLVARYGVARPHSPVLDPAAWLVHLELDQHQLQPNFLVSPGGPGLDIYLEQVFDRSDERLASVMLPELLWETEPEATLAWSELAAQAAEDEALRETLALLAAELFPAAAGAAERPGLPGAGQVLEAAIASLSVLADDALADGPPDRLRLEQLRYMLLAAMPGLDATGRADARSLLRLGNLVTGLYERRYFAFAEGLLAVVTDLLARAGQAGAEDTEQPVVVTWLTRHLPGVSASFARDFASVDPRLNSALAAAYDVVQNIPLATGEARAAVEFRRELGDVVAQLALLNPDLDYYFELPVRDIIAGSVDTCTEQMALRNPDGTAAMTRELFDDCQESLVNLADVEARAASLAGDPDGPFGAAQLQRELSVTSGQRINYGIGYLHDRYATGCEKPAKPLPNPLEWSALANLLAWFAEQSPVFFQTPGNEARLARMRAIGNELISTVAEQVDCFTGAGASLNDPVSRSLQDYRVALATLRTGLDSAVTGLRGQMLKPGADIALQGDAAQPTGYRPDDLMIGPCDPERICEMDSELSSTRALLGLFPEIYLVADQSGFGEVEICYDNMEWVRRRSELVRPDDPNVANYFGHLGFDLRGRFDRDGVQTDVFGFRFTSPGEQHYLFAAATEEVLADSCPMEWVGTQIVSPLRNDRIRIVPDRLTYLAAPRMLPSRLLSQNWDRGAEWRDWFITGIGIEALELAPAEDIGATVTGHLQSLYREQQSTVYESMLRPASRSAASAVDSLFEEVTALTTGKALIRTQMMLFYPQKLMESDALRAAVAGQGGLLDSLTLARFQEGNVPVAELERIAFERLEQFQAEWRSQAEATLRTGSVAGHLAHAMLRLNALHRQYFAPVPAGAGDARLSPLAAPGAD